MFLDSEAKLQNLERKRVRKMQIDFATRAYLTRNETIEKIAEEFKISPESLRKKIYKTEDDAESEESLETDNELGTVYFADFSLFGKLIHFIKFKHVESRILGQF